MHGIYESLIVGGFAFIGVVLSFRFNVINKSRVEWIKEVRENLELFIISYEKVSICALDYLYENQVLNNSGIERNERIQQLSNEIKAINQANIEFMAISNKLKTYFSKYTIKRNIIIENTENLIIYEFIDLLEINLNSYTKDLMNNDTSKYLKNVGHSDVLETNFTDDLLKAFCDEISYNLKLSWEDAKRISLK